MCWLREMEGMELLRKHQVSGEAGQGEARAWPGESGQVLDDSNSTNPWFFISGMGENLETDGLATKQTRGRDVLSASNSQNNTVCNLSMGRQKSCCISKCRSFKI